MQKKPLTTQKNNHSITTFITNIYMHIWKIIVFSSGLWLVLWGTFYYFVCVCVMCAEIPVCKDTHMPHMGVMVLGQSWLPNCLWKRLLFFAAVYSKQTGLGVSRDPPGLAFYSAVGVLAIQVPITLPSSKGVPRTNMWVLVCWLLLFLICILRLFLFSYTLPLKVQKNMIQGYSPHFYTCRDTLAHQHICF